MIKKMTDEQIATLHALADQGTREAIEEIQKTLDNATTEEQISYGNIALSEAKYHYFLPTNPQERRDFDLCFLINEREDKILEKTMELEDVRNELSDEELKKEVHTKMMETGNVPKEWEYFPEEVLIMLKNKISELESDIAYHEKWVETAKSLIKSFKYKDPDLDIFNEIAKGEWQRS